VPFAARTGFLPRETVVGGNLPYGVVYAADADRPTKDKMKVENDPHRKSAFLSSNRMISLSDTIFGVAMTLQASTLLPSILTLKGTVLDIWHGLHGQFIAVALGFAISGSYWLVQQRRLEMTKTITPLQTLLHFIFLFLFVLLPLSTAMWGQYGETRPVVVIYGAHLMLIALVNLLLWIDVHRSNAVHAQIVRSALALSLFVVALVLGPMKPVIAPYLWFAVFATSFIRPNLARRLYGA
jgi:uncharacterized membrane protein